MDEPMTGRKIKKLCLNEVFAAEKDVSCTSMYRLNADGRNLGKFKSSGIIISTGTGSSGWLYSTKQIYPEDFTFIERMIGTTLLSEVVSNYYLNYLGKRIFQLDDK